MGGVEGMGGVRPTVGLTVLGLGETIKLVGLRGEVELRRELLELVTELLGFELEFGLSVGLLRLRFC